MLLTYTNFADKRISDGFVGPATNGSALERARAVADYANYQLKAAYLTLCNIAAQGSATPGAHEDRSPLKDVVIAGDEKEKSETRADRGR